MRECSIELSDACLDYPSSPYRTFTLKELFFTVAKFKRPKALIHDVKALQNLTFAAQDGQRIGVIGPNGAGKSTLLRAVAGVYPLSSGVRKIAGSVRSLFEINLGFEYEATGRENILYRALLMGETPEAIREKQDEIIEFAGLGEFIDYPVKAYSAGMLVRLAFAISTSFHSEILLVDEVLGAGDASFMKKAKARIGNLIDGARIMVLVSHDLTSVRDICNRAIWIDHGRVMDDGDPGSVVKAYLKSCEQPSAVQTTL